MCIFDLVVEYSSLYILVYIAAIHVMNQIPVIKWIVKLHTCLVLTGCTGLQLLHECSIAILHPRFIDSVKSTPTLEGGAQPENVYPC